MEYIYLELEGESKVRVFDLKGQTLMQGAFTGSMRLDVSGFDAGVYFLEVSQKGIIKTEKFIKTN